MTAETKTNTPQADDLVRITTAAALVGRDQASVHRAVTAGTLPCHKTADGLRLVLPDDVARWAKECRPGRPKKK